LKILVLSTCYPRHTAPNHGIFIHRQIRALVELGVECHVLQPADWSPPAPLHRLYAGWQHGHDERRDMLDEVDGVPVHHPRTFLPLPSRLFPGDYWTRVGWGVARYVKHRKNLRNADAIYAHFLCHEGYAGLIAARKLNLPLVAIARGDDVHLWPQRWPDRKPKLAAVLKEAKGLLACSAGLARDAEQWATDGLSCPFEVVYNGIETDLYTPAGSPETRRAARQQFNLPQEARLLLCVGTPVVEKGWLDLLDALAALKLAQWHVVMAGARRGAGDLDLTGEAARRGVAAHWLGLVDAARMPALYQAVDAFVLASHNEGLSKSVLEAMAAGLPVVATDVGGHAEIITDANNGRLVAARDVAALTNALRDVMNDEAHAAQMGRAARQRALSVGTPLANAAHLQHYLARVLGMLK
jgi:glycosyltransferase involved in cell wall biosynthesis